MKKDIVQAIGVDIGGTYTKIGLVNNKGEISNLQKIRTIVDKNNPAEFIKIISDTTKLLSRIYKGPIVGIGVSCLGMQNEEGTGPCVSVNIPELNGFNIRDCLAGFTGYDVKITNDLMSHTLAEYYFGVGHGSNRFMCVPLGTGIGAGVIINGEPVELWCGTSGDSGRISLDLDSELICEGHVRGSAEALCGVVAIEKYARMYYGKEGITARQVIEACKSGQDPIAEKIITKVGHYTGQLIATISMVFAPNIVALAGGTTNAGPVLLESCREKFNEIAGGFFDLLVSSNSGVHSGVEIIFGEIKGEAGLVGGALGVLKPFL